jgi:hypothetical protein
VGAWGASSVSEMNLEPALPRLPSSSTPLGSSLFDPLLLPLPLVPRSSPRRGGSGSRLQQWRQQQRQQALGLHRAGVGSGLFLCQGGREGTRAGERERRGSASPHRSSFTGCSLENTLFLTLSPWTLLAHPLQVDVHPNASAPLLRNEKGRKDWLEKELDMCNQVRASCSCVGCEGLDMRGKRRRSGAPECFSMPGPSPSSFQVF